MKYKVRNLDTQTEKTKQKNNQTHLAKQKQRKVEKRKGKGDLEEEKEKASRFFNDITRQKENLRKRKDELRKRGVNKSRRKNNTERHECKMYLRLLNVDGLSDKKATIIKEMFMNEEKEYNIVCMTETHHRYERIIEKELTSFTQMREKNKRKGGGLQILMRENKRVEFEKKKRKNEEILEIEGICYGMEMKIILVYFDVRRNEEGRENNERIRKDIENMIENNKSDGLLILGDFNGHLETLDGRKEDKNGRMVMEWTTNYDLVLMNTDNKCEGTITREKGEQKTAIDMVLMNRNLYEKCKTMKIDEERDIIDISDHNLISIEFNVRQKSGHSYNKNKWIEEEYYKKGEDALKEYGDEVENIWKNRKIESVEEMTLSMKEAADRILKKIIKKRVSEEGEWKRIESVWMNEEIREAWKKRREINRKKRKSKNTEEKEKLENDYQRQKEKVHMMIREAKERYELELTEEIMKDKGSGTVWKNIIKLSGKEQRKEPELKIYEDGKLMEIEKALDDFFEVWELIYNMSKNEIDEIWENDTLQNLVEELREEENSMENRDMEMSTNKMIVPMKATEMTDEDLKTKLSKLKNNKAAGPDCLKAELFKELGKRESCREVMIKCFNKILEGEDTPKSWNVSRTKMIRKGRKPTVKDFRPIAITNISYKIFMSFIREKIEEHIRKNNLTKDNQVGFTGGGRIEYNHMMLQYIVEKSLNENKDEQLIVTTLDFKKAFDSIKRKELIETLIKYKINPKIIDIVAKLYKNDETVIKMGDREETIKIGSGIKQGCTASTEFFKLVTYEIIKELEEKGEKFTIGDICINSIFFADDSIALAKTINATRKNLKIIKEVSKKFGLIVNEEKSKILIFKKKRQ